MKGESEYRKIFYKNSQKDKKKMAITRKIILEIITRIFLDFSISEKL
jgi:transcriptional/translational regulatory protein YebC/TACO1